MLGGGSALLCSPIDEITLNEKLTVIRKLAQNGADIQQLNIVRGALSRVKGGGLVALGSPSRMIGLIMSDVIGDPLDIISSGPTVPPDTMSAVRKMPLEILKELGVEDKIPSHIIDILRRKEVSRGLNFHFIGLFLVNKILNMQNHTGKIFYCSLNYFKSVKIILVTI